MKTVKYGEEISEQSARGRRIRTWEMCFFVSLRLGGNTFFITFQRGEDKLLGFICAHIDNIS